MTNQQHPITPPLALINQWWDEAQQNAKYNEPIGPLVATQAAQWGADQELEACCEWLKSVGLHTYALHTVRRPKPPSLKEQALEAISRCDSEIWCEEMEFDLAIIRTALESLPS